MFTRVDLATLEILYLQGDISGPGLAAIAPISWLAYNHPELINTRDKVIAAIAVQKTCKACIHFSSVHQCCTTRIQSDCKTYVAVTQETNACRDFEGVSLPILKPEAK